MARKSDFTLPPIPVDAIFSTQAERDDALLERVHNIPLEELHPFRDHPFKIKSGEELDKMIESIRKVGAITPALARPLEGGGFELISGHRRLAACQVLGLKTMPVIVREMTDDEAVIVMVDANLQRETILPSEKAFAYRMKLEAIKHQGRSISRQLVGKESADTLSNDESGRQVQRYIRLTYLISELLTKVDEGKIAFSPAVEISFLTEDEQRILLDAIELNDSTPSHAQSIRLKKLSQDCVLSKDQIYEIMSEEKPNQQEHLRFRREDFNGYFPKSYTEQQIKKDILKGLELLHRHRQRNRDAR